MVYSPHANNIFITGLMMFFWFMGVRGLFYMIDSGDFVLVMVNRFIGYGIL